MVAETPEAWTARSLINSTEQGGSEIARADRSRQGSPASPATPPDARSGRRSPNASPTSSKGWLKGSGSSRGGHRLCLARAFVVAALQGRVPFAKEVIDRLEGKVPDRIAGPGGGHVVVKVLRNVRVEDLKPRPALGKPG